jgi:hypothetical protein
MICGIQTQYQQMPRTVEVTQVIYVLDSGESLDGRSKRARREQTNWEHISF